MKCDKIDKQLMKLGIYSMEFVANNWSDFVGESFYIHELFQYGESACLTVIDQSTISESDMEQVWTFYPGEAYWKAYFFMRYEDDTIHAFGRIHQLNMYLANTHKKAKALLDLCKSHGIDGLSIIAEHKPLVLEHFTKLKNKYDD